MTVPLWVAELAEAFWQRAGAPGRFPRCLRGPIARAFDLAVVDLPGLRLSSALAWLGRQRIVIPLTERDRPLRACLVARGGVGFAFLDADDPEDERRFSLAHELAHFLRDYWLPRTEAERALGSAVLEVLDGTRPPTPTERLHALLANVRVGYHTHLIRRDTLAPATLDAVEQSADRLAFELLAPAAAVGADPAAGRAALADRLARGFGLPGGPARAYASLLAGVRPGTDILIAGLKKTENVSKFGPVVGMEE